MSEMCRQYADMPPMKTTVACISVAHSNLRIPILIAVRLLLQI